jgi:hypothetical protein
MDENIVRETYIILGSSKKFDVLENLRLFNDELEIEFFKNIET